MVVLRLIVIESRKIKVKINVDRNVAIKYGLGNFIGLEMIRFEVVAKCFTHVVNPDWERAVVRAIRACNRPLAFEILGGEVTCVIDFRKNPEPVDVGSTDDVGSRFHNAGRANFAGSELKVEFAGLPQERNLDSTVTLSNVSADQSGDHATSKP